MNSSRYSARSRRSAVILGASERAKGGPPALLEDGQFGPFDAAVGVRVSGLDPPLASALGFDGAAELARGELGAVIRRHLAQFPARGLELAGDAVDQLGRPSGPGVALRRGNSAQTNPRGDVGGGVLPDGPLSSPTAGRRKSNPFALFGQALGRRCDAPAAPGRACARRARRDGQPRPGAWSACSTALPGARPTGSPVGLRRAPPRQDLQAGTRPGAGGAGRGRAAGDAPARSPAGLRGADPRASWLSGRGGGVARKLACLAWQLLTKGEDYAFERPQLTQRKLRRLELVAGEPRRRGKANGASSKDPAREAAERAAAERAEAAYRRLVADWKASGTGGSRAGAGASQGRASEAARQGSAPGPAL